MLAPMSTFAGVEAKAALEAVEAVLGDMVAADLAGNFTVAAQAIAKELSSGRYPKLMLYIATHQASYPRVTEIVGVLVMAAMRSSAIKTGPVQ